MPCFVYIILTSFRGNKFNLHLVYFNFLWLVVTAFKIRGNTFSSKTKNSLNKLEEFVCHKDFKIECASLHWWSQKLNPKTKAKIGMYSGDLLFCQTQGWKIKSY